MKNENLTDLQKNLEKNIIGQERAMETVARAFWIGENARENTPSPKTVSLFLGPSGVGKTETAKLVARHLYGSEDTLIRFDMSEFMDLASVSEFRGSETNPEGRIGRALNGKNDGIIFFDEIEKAHTKILDLFLQFFSDSRITTFSGTVYNVRDFHIICTSNVGADRILFASNNAEYSTLKKSLESELNEEWRTEFVGRFKDIIIFDRLRPAVQKTLAKQKLDRYIGSLNKQGHNLTYMDDLPEYLARTGCSNYYGARELMKTITATVGSALRNAAMDGKSTSGLLSVNYSRGCTEILSGKEEIAAKMLEHFREKHKSSYHIDMSVSNYILSLDIEDTASLIDAVRRNLNDTLEPGKTGRVHYCGKAEKLLIDETYTVRNGKADIRAFSPWANK